MRCEADCSPLAPSLPRRGRVAAEAERSEAKAAGWGMPHNGSAVPGSDTVGLDRRFRRARVDASAPGGMQPCPTKGNGEGERASTSVPIHIRSRQAHPVRSAVIGNAGSLVVSRVGSRDAELLAPEFRPMEDGALADQEPLSAWLRRGISRDRIFAEPKLYQPLGTAEPIRVQSRQRFGRSRRLIEKQLHA